VQQQVQKGSRERRQRATTAQSMTLEVVIRQPQRDVPLYAWDREHACLSLTGFHRAEGGLPADMATFELEMQKEAPVLVLLLQSLAPGTRLQAHLVGALSYGAGPAHAADEQPLPLDTWLLVAVAEVDPNFSAIQTIEQVPPAQLAVLQSYVRTQAAGGTARDEIRCAPAQEAAQLIRESRLLLKQKLRTQSKGPGWFAHDEEEQIVTWRAIEGLSSALRAEVLKRNPSDPEAPHAQPERLIRFVPQRFQHALADLLLDDERLLFFIERPLLRHRTGWLGLQQWRSNEGLFLVTDRQVLWLRDFHSPGANFLQGGYIAHSAPFERMRAITLLEAGRAPAELAARLEEQESPYLRLVIELESQSGSELFVVEFPQGIEQEKALTHVVGLLRGFLPYADGTQDRRVRRLPEVDAWQPSGAEREKLAGLGGTIPVALREQMAQRLSALLAASGEEALVSVAVPALEEYRSPARLIALSRCAVLVLEAEESRRQQTAGGIEESAVKVQRYDLSMLTSAQLRSSLVGSSLSLFVPRMSGPVQRVVVPFHSPALAWFVPLFTRLRVALTGPYQTQ
jgi:inorganic pyrophosphatase